MLRGSRGRSSPCRCGAQVCEARAPAPGLPGALQATGEAAAAGRQRDLRSYKRLMGARLAARTGSGRRGHGQQPLRRPRSVAAPMRSGLIGMYVQFAFFHSCQITLIFSHLNLGRISKPVSPGEKLVYQSSHLSNALR